MTEFRLADWPSWPDDGRGPIGAGTDRRPRPSARDGGPGVVARALCVSGPALDSLVEKLLKEAESEPA